MLKIINLGIMFVYFVKTINSNTKEELKRNLSIWIITVLVMLVTDAKAREAISLLVSWLIDMMK